MHASGGRGPVRSSGRNSPHMPRGHARLAAHTRPVIAPAAGEGVELLAPSSTSSSAESEQRWLGLRWPTTAGEWIAAVLGAALMIVWFWSLASGSWVIVGRPGMMPPSPPAGRRAFAPEAEAKAEVEVAASPPHPRPALPPAPPSPRHPPVSLCDAPLPRACSGTRRDGAAPPTAHVANFASTLRKAQERLGLPPPAASTAWLLEALGAGRMKDPSAARRTHSLNGVTWCEDERCRCKPAPSVDLVLAGGEGRIVLAFFPIPKVCT